MDGEEEFYIGWGENCLTMLWNFAPKINKEKKSSKTESKYCILIELEKSYVKEGLGDCFYFEKKAGSLFSLENTYGEGEG